MRNLLPSCVGKEMYAVRYSLIGQHRYNGAKSNQKQINAGLAGDVNDFENLVVWWLCSTYSRIRVRTGGNSGNPECVDPLTPLGNCWKLKQHQHNNIGHILIEAQKSIN